jgi:hypothetical protein
MMKKMPKEIREYFLARGVTLEAIEAGEKWYPENFKEFHYNEVRRKIAALRITEQTAKPDASNFLVLFALMLFIAALLTWSAVVGN